jgi:hypothetical protein
MKNAAKKSNIGLSLRKDKHNIIITAPNPYIGQSGPVKKPLFTNFFSITDFDTDSKSQPAKEYNMKYAKK